MNQLDLQSRVAVVTGGARGIGRAIAERMTASGASVAIWDRDPAEADAAAAALGAGSSAHEVDQTDEDAVRAATAATLERHGHIDILVNNAGITGGNAPTWELPPAEWRRVIEVNLIGPYLVSAAVAPAHEGPRLRPGRQHRLRRRQGGQPERQPLQRQQGRADRAHQVARQGACRHRRAGQLRHPRRRQDRHLQPDEPSRRSTTCCPRSRWAASSW